jgi:spore coat polysaccharide biosynthesis protein SpsF
MDNMVDNAYIILQARMDSERLPGKVMKLIDGKPMIGILFERLKNGVIPIILATSTNPENDVLVNYARNSGILIFRGSESNVLERYYQAAKSVNAEVVIRLTGDNPFLEGRFVEELLDYYGKMENNRLYLTTGLSKTFPLGISVEIFSFKLLEEAYNFSDLPGEFEHVTPYIHQNRPGDIKILSYRDNKERFHYRLTVDTQSDFQLIKIMIENYNCDKKSVYEIIEFLDIHPELAKLNSSVIQKTWN